jgi:pyridinium-3,5-bisthiocarboxylic acid mononucleotide nickel chelatase
MRIGYFDCFSGASGDMILGALIDAGVSVADLNSVLQQLGLGNVRIESEETNRSHIRGTKAHVRLPENIPETECAGHSHHAGEHSNEADQPKAVHHHGAHEHTTFADIEDLISKSNLDAQVKTDSVRVFSRLAVAEGRIHGTAPEKVTFHEVGALDSIADIVCSVAGMHLLGLNTIYVSPYSVARGYIHSAHGRLPLPAPATMELLQGCEMRLMDFEGELVTPTGAAILTALGVQASPPPFQCERVGYGAGGKQREELANLLRLMVGTTTGDGADEEDFVWVIESNVDDMTPEVFGYLYDRLFAVGALDVFMTPVQMKKSRPGILITCIAPVGKELAAEEILFRETTTFGIRKFLAKRAKLSRDFRTVMTRYGAIRIKIGSRSGQKVTASPEYDDCRRAAEASGVPLKEVYSEATSLARLTLP